MIRFFNHHFHQIYWSICLLLFAAWVSELVAYSQVHYSLLRWAIIVPISGWFGATLYRSQLNSSKAAVGYLAISIATVVVLKAFPLGGIDYSWESFFKWHIGAVIFGLVYTFLKGEFKRPAET